MKGTVEWYDERKKYGLIKGEDRKEIFVYEKDLPFLTLLDTGDEVEYQIKKIPGGSKAVNVKITKDSLFRSSL